MSEQIQQEITQEEAIRLANSNWWGDKTPEEIVRFQLFTERLCMPFDKFHEALTEALGRSVWTHELAKVEDIKKEFLKEKEAPTFDEILNIIPEEKRIVFITGAGQ